MAHARSRAGGRVTCGRGERRRRDVEQDLQRLAQLARGGATWDDDSKLGEPTRTQLNLEILHLGHKRVRVPSLVVAEPVARGESSWAGGAGAEGEGEREVYLDGAGRLDATQLR